MKKTIILLGNMTFHHFSDEELEKYFGGKDQVESHDNQMCLVHRVDMVLHVDNADLGLEMAEKLLEDKYESYVALGVFNGRIAYEDEKDKILAERLAQ